MKTRLKLLTIAFCLIVGPTEATTSNPHPLQPSISIQRIKDVNQYITRMARRPTDGRLFYTTGGVKIYRVAIGSTVASSDTMVYDPGSSAPQLDEIQGILFSHDTLYISGNRNIGNPEVFTQGVIARGIPSGNSWSFSVIMITDSIQSCGRFDHKLSGFNITPDGDSLVFCIGARGDHGEIQTNGGVYPGLRNPPLTTNIYKIPARDSSPIQLRNDSTFLDTCGYLYARGIRNTYDLDYTADGNLFGVENSGDYDHNEEMNWLRPGRHYGFPWVMGSNDNPQQYAGFNPANDRRIPPCCATFQLGYWYNDPTFAQPPAGITFSLPMKNFGPDADLYRDTAGLIHDASAEGIPLATFTGHRSPLGLVFDNDSVLCPQYRGDGFTLSWTAGTDSTGCISSTSMGVFVDSSQDLLHLHLTYDPLEDNYRTTAQRIVGGFIHPVDAVLDSNTLYVIEWGAGAVVPGLYAVTLPASCNSCIAPSNDSCILAQNLGLNLGAGGCVQDTVVLQGSIVCSAIEDTSTCNSGSSIGDVWYRFDSDGRPFSLTLQSQQSVSVSFYSGTGCNSLSSDTCLSGLSTGQTISLTDLYPGPHYIRVSGDSAASQTDFQLRFLFEPLTLEITDSSTTSCISCSDGSITFAVGGSVSVDSIYLSPDTGLISGSTVSNLPAGPYVLCITDLAGCTACDSATVDFNTKVNTVGNQLQASVYPNPNSGIFGMKTKGAIGNNIYITDCTGRIVFTGQVMADNTLLDLTHLESGTYFISLDQHRMKTPLVIIH